MPVVAELTGLRQFTLTDRPTPDPYSVSITITVAVNSLSWSGPVDVTM